MNKVTALSRQRIAVGLMTLYPTNKIAHAYWTPGLETPREDGKMEVRARLPSGHIHEGYMEVYEPVTAAHWKKHLDGERALVPGIACEDGTSKSCTVDVDVYGLDLSVLTVRAADRAPGIPLYVCRSKSRGGHVTAFTREPLPVADQNLIARGIAKTLGLLDPALNVALECFPDARPPKPGKPARGLNMPYLGGRDYVTGFVRPNKSTEEIPLAEFLARVQYLSQEQIDALKQLGSTVKLKSDKRSAAPGSSGGGDTDDERGRGYADRALEDLIAELGSVALGGRNEAINRIVFRLGTMVASGWLDRGTVRSRLEAEVVDAAWQCQGASREKAISDIERHLDDSKDTKHSPLPEQEDHAEVIAEMNKKYAFVRVGSDSMVIAEEPEFTLMKVKAFYDETCNRTVTVGSGRRAREVPVGWFWMHHPDRRTYRGITFDPSRLDVPDKYNLWKGFPVESRPGDCSKFLAHVLENVAGGNQEYFDWIMAFFADIFQNPAPRAPARKSDTALVIRGAQGVGKNKLGDTIGTLLGAYYFRVDDSDGITGRFNRHLRSLLLLQADEAFWAGSKDAAGKLKSLITADTIQIEGKGVDRFSVKNHMRLFINGNEDWIVPAEPGERRYAVFEVKDTRKEDAEYFRAIDEEMENGGREALMHYLMNFDLTKVNIRKIPQTQALLSQKIHNMRSHEEWWYEVLQEGELPWGCNVERTCPVRHLYENYKSQAQGRRSSPPALGMFLAKMGARKTKLTYSTVDNGQPVRVTAAVYTFEALAECRERFAKFLKQAVEWQQNPSDDWIVRDREVQYRAGV
jgi:hypothetical protein